MGFCCLHGCSHDYCTDADAAETMDRKKETVIYQSLIKKGHLKWIAPSGSIPSIIYQLATTTSSSGFFFL